MLLASRNLLFAWMAATQGVSFSESFLGGLAMGLGVAFGVAFVGWRRLLRLRNIENALRESAQSGDYSKPLSGEFPEVRHFNALMLRLAQWGERMADQWTTLAFGAKTFSKQDTAMGVTEAEVFESSQTALAEIRASLELLSKKQRLLVQSTEPLAQVLETEKNQGLVGAQALSSLTSLLPQGQISAGGPTLQAMTDSAHEAGLWNKFSDTQMPCKLLQQSWQQAV